MAAGFGIFSPLFEGGSGYLSLLNLDKPANKAVAEVVEQCRMSSACHKDVGKLFDQPDWRPHLVGAVAVSALPYDQESSGKLWAAIDGGSWVTPQLAVAAFIRDPAFVDAARARIRSRCPVDVPRFVGSAAAIRQHSETGPAHPGLRSAKTAASLIYLAGLLPLRPDWLDTELSKPDLINLLATDIDHAAGIAEHWLGRLKEILNLP